MALGVMNPLGTINITDTAELQAYLRVNEQPVTADQIEGVVFTVQYPLTSSNITATYTLPTTTIVLSTTDGWSTEGGTFVAKTNLGIEDDFAYTGITGNTLTGVTGGTAGQIINNMTVAYFDTTAITDGLVMPDGSGFLRWTDTANPGEYIAQAQFTLITGEKRSVMLSFAVIDPFNPPLPTQVQQVTDQVMLRLEDCFDSTEGGPWLRDRTMAHFDASKIADFIPEALMDINLQMPPTSYDLGLFTTLDGSSNPNLPLLVKGVLVLTIRHLMRSYTEQFTPTGQGQLVWADRTKYQQMWGEMYKVEYEDYIAAVRLWKRTEYKFGQSALLTLSKAGRLYPFARMSSRGIYRGYT